MSGEQEKHSNAILWGTSAVVVVIVIIWLNFSVELTKLFLNIKSAELYFISIFARNPFYNFTDEILSTKALINSIYGSTISRDQAILLGNVINTKLILFLFFINFILILKLYQKNKASTFNRVYNMQKLREQESINWPQILPSIDENIIEQDIETGPWAMAMNPLQFCLKHDLIIIEKHANQKALWRSEGYNVLILKKDKAYKVFRRQLGEHWTCFEDLPDYMQGLYAAFLARAENNSKLSRKLLDDMAISYTNGEMDFSLVSEIMKKYKNSKLAQRCINKHSFIYTVMMQMLELARLDGVLAANDFLWLKKVDRVLWYSLNGVGRKVPFCEIAGIFAHYITEKEMARSLKIPVVEQAHVALEKAIANIKYEPEL